MMTTLNTTLEMYNFVLLFKIVWHQAQTFSEK